MNALPKLLLALTAAAAFSFAQYAWARPPSRTPVDVNIVAHQDDDILFMNPDILNAVVAGHRQVTVYITAGNIGLNPDFGKDYSLGREAGAIAGYQKLLQLADAIRRDPNHFNDFTGTFQGDSRYPAGCENSFCFPCTEHADELSTEGAAVVDYPADYPEPLTIGSGNNSRNLTVAKIGGSPEQPTVMLIFLRVDSGCTIDSEPDPGCEPPAILFQLFTSNDPTLQIQSRFNDPNDPNYTRPYTKQQLGNTLVDILRFIQPNKVRTQDPADGHSVDYKLGSTTTTIGSASDGQTLPDSGPYTITVASTTGFPTIGAVDINVNGVHNVVTYTGTTSTTFTGCHQGIPSTILHAGDVVTSDLVDVLPDRGCNQTRAIGYDHSDHVWGARFARQAIIRYDNLPNSQNQPTYFTYKGYNLEWNEPQPPTRLSTKDFCLKKGIFFNYAVHDDAATDLTDAAHYDIPAHDNIPDNPNNFNCYSYDYIGYQKGQQQQSP